MTELLSESQKNKTIRSQDPSKPHMLKGRKRWDNIKAFCNNFNHLQQTLFLLQSCIKKERSF